MILRIFWSFQEPKVIAPGLNWTARPEKTALSLWTSMAHVSFCSVETCLKAFERLKISSIWYFWIIQNPEELSAQVSCGFSQAKVDFTS